MATSSPTPQLPPVLWVFLDSTSFLTAHNVTFTKQLWSTSAIARDQGESTSDWISAIRNPSASPWGNSPFVNSLLARYWTEYNGEVRRLQSWTACPSRLASLFAFGDEDSCRIASRLYGWDLSEVRRFRPLNVVNWGRFDMSVITLMNTVIYRTKTPVTEIPMWDHYWSSVGTPVSYEIPDVTPGQRMTLTTDPLVWEYLIDGALQLI